MLDFKVKSTKVELDSTRFLSEVTYDGTDIDNTVATAQAWINNLVVVYPKPNQLFLDIDDDEALAKFYKVSSLLAAKYGRGYHRTITPSRSGGTHRHVTITLEKDVTPMERITLQAILGSDPLRELLSLDRLKAGCPNPTLFFEVMK